MMRKPVVVSGMGVVSSVGLGIKEFEATPRQGRSGICWLKSHDETPLSIKIGAELRDFSFMAMLGREAGFGSGQPAKIHE